MPPAGAKNGATTASLVLRLGDPETILFAVLLWALDNSFNLILAFTEVALGQFNRAKSGLQSKAEKTFRQLDTRIFCLCRPVAASTTEVGGRVRCADILDGPLPFTLCGQRRTPPKSRAFADPLCRQSILYRFHRKNFCRIAPAQTFFGNNRGEQSWLRPLFPPLRLQRRSAWKFLQQSLRVYRSHQPAPRLIQG